MYKKFLYFNLLLFIGLFIFGGFFVGSQNQNKVSTGLIPTPTVSIISNDRISAKVTYVVDGDTVKVLINGKEDTVRLIGIDAPETVDEKKPVQCFGRQASDKVREVLVGKTIVLESDTTQGDRDEYGRLLRYVFLNDLNLNLFMINEGFAREYTFRGNSYRYQPDFIQAEKAAKKESKGLWKSC